jgi:uncharacterized NAD-dependent epimerase/dehydratase family protein
VIAVALNTFDLGEDAALRIVEETQRETGLPTTDPVRFDPPRSWTPLRLPRGENDGE